MSTDEKLQIDTCLDQIRHITADIPGCFLTYDHIESKHLFREDLGLDSLAMVDLMVAVEDTFGVYFDPVRMDLDAAFETVESLAVLVTHIMVV